MRHRPLEKAFTLIELSIVLVIIGLIVGGILVGRDLIAAAEIRSQITQIEQFQTAKNVFKGKYAYLPGDIPALEASRFGFAARGSSQGQGDGNGLIEGDGGQWNYEYLGETIMFWSDLTYANGMNLSMIPGNFNLASSTAGPAGGTDVTGTTIARYLPKAKMGNTNYLFVSGDDGNNYFTLSTVTAIVIGDVLNLSSTSITVNSAYGIDKKLDDGTPVRGTITAGSAPSTGGLMNFNCFNFSANTYSTATYGNNANCMLSIKFQ